MKKYKNYLLLIGLLLIPAIVYAEETGEDISIWQTLILEVFFTIPISFFVFLPIAKAVDPQNAKNKFRFYSILRAGIIFIGLFTNKEALIGCDILAIFIGFLIVVPIVKLRAINSLNKKNAQNLNTSVIVNLCSYADFINSYICVLNLFFIILVLYSVDWSMLGMIFDRRFKLKSRYFEFYPTFK